MEKRGQGKANFSLKLLEKMRKIDFELEFQTKIGFDMALSFLSNKSNAVAWLYRFLAQLVLQILAHF